MNTVKMKSLALFGLLIGTSALAQTQNQDTGSVNAQITMTRDYTQSLLTKIGSVPANRFNESSDYSTTGRKINVLQQQALTDFRNAMDVLMIGSFTDSIAIYNETFNDTKLPDAEKKKTLELQRQIINQQVQSVSVIYQGELKRLYQIIPAMTLVKIASDRKEGYGQFADGSSELFWTWGDRKGAEQQSQIWTQNFLNGADYNYSVDQNGAPKNMFQRQFNKYIKSVCATRVCASGVLQQLSNYFLYVDTYLNRNLTITLADGSSINIECLKGKAGSLQSDAIIKIVPSFVFDASYTNLPLKN